MKEGRQSFQTFEKKPDGGNPKVVSTRCIVILPGSFRCRRGSGPLRGPLERGSHYDGPQISA